MKHAKKRNPFIKYWLRRKLIRKFVDEIKKYKSYSDEFPDFYCWYDEYENIKNDLWNRLKIILP